MKKVLVEGGLHGFGLGGVGRGVPRVYGERCDLREGGEVLVIHGRGGEAEAGELGRAGITGANVVPVAEAVVEEIVF